MKNFPSFFFKTKLPNKMIEIKEGPQEEMKDARKKKDPLIGSKDLRKEELKETTMVGL